VRLAFYDRDPLGWILMYGVVDFSFLTDLVLTFFTSYTDETTNKEIYSHKKIARTYFSSWFFFDLCSVLPIDYIL